MHHGCEGTSRRSTRAIVASTLVGMAAASSIYAQAGNPDVQAGDVTFNIDGNTYTIEQLTDRAIINWQDFSIEAGHLMLFDQPGATSAVLNRVISGNPSLLLGDLRANGQVYLLNPNGVLVGPSANIRTQTFVASALDVADSDFLAGGDLTFTGSSDAPVINHGQIRAIGGDVFLIARAVENHGRLKATDGVVGMAAGSEVLLKQAGDRRLFVQAGSGFAETGIENTGNVLAAHAELAAAGGNVYALAINQSGVVRANGVQHDNGRILLTAEGGTLRNSGELRAPGGDVRVLGDDVTVAAGSLIDVSIDFGDAGQVLIGGDYLGSNPDVYNADETLVDFGARIRADGGDHGHGGRVIIWSDGRTRFGGRVTARGGAFSGDGGFVEVSGKNQLLYRGRVDVRAPNGSAGTLLLDPNDIVIADGSGASAAPGTWDDDGGASITIYEEDLEAAVGNVVLNAAADIIFNDLSDGELTIGADSIRFLSNNEPNLTNVGGVLFLDMSDTVRLTTPGAWVEFQGGNISSGARPRNASMDLGNIITNGGDIFLTLKRASPATPIYVQNITTGGGAITVDRLDMNNSNDVDFVSEGLLDTSGGDIDITLVGSINIDAGINLGAGTLTFSGTNTNLNSAITAVGDVTIGSVLNFGAGASISTDGSITFTDTANMNPGGSLTLSGSDFDFQDTFAGNAGSLTLQPNSVAGNMTIDAATFANIDGFASVTMGRADGTGTATLTGNINITDPFAVIMGGVGGDINQTGTITGIGDASITYTAGGVIDIDGTIDVPDGITLTAPAVDIAAALDAGAGDFTINTDALAYTTTLTGSGALIIQPLDDATTIGIGDGAAGGLSIDDAELANLTPGFASYTFGSATGTGDIDVRDHTFDADLTIRSGGAGGDITLSAALATSSGGITLDAGGFVALASGSSITTQAGNVDITTGTYFDTASGTTITTNDGDFTATIGANSVSPTERAIRSSIATAAGAIAITATNPSHLRFRGANLSTTTGDIGITVGAGGANGSKIELFDGSTLTTQDGAITLTNSDTDGWILLGGAGDGTGVLEATGTGTIDLANSSRTYIRSGSRIETAGGQITLDTAGLTVGDVGSGDITASGGAVLLDSDDTIDFGAGGMVTADDLGVVADGATTINSTVSNLAVQKASSGALTLVNTGALTIADLSALDASLNVTSIAGNADSVVTAASPITFAVDTTSNVGSGNTMTWASADDGGGPADDNITVNTAVTVSESTGSLVFSSGDAFVMNGTASVSAAETLIINADNGAAQNAAATITAQQLLITGSGDFDLLGAANDTDTIAANLTGALTYVDADGFSIGSINGTDGLTSTTAITLDAGAAVTQTEAITADELLLLGGVDYTLTNAGNDIDTIAGNVDDLDFRDAGGFVIGAIDGTNGMTATGTVELTAGAAVTQTEAITANRLSLLGGVDYTLTNVGNDVNRIAAVTDNLSFTDADGFVIGPVNGASGIAANGTVALTAGAAVTQTEAITADELLLLGGVDYTLDHADNDANTVAADAEDLVFTDTDGFVIGSINGTDGLTATNAVTLTAGGAVTQSEAVNATDLLLLGGVDYTLFNASNDVNTIAADADDFAYADSDGFTIGSINGTDGISASSTTTLSAGGTVTQSEAITGTGLALLGGNDYTLTNAANDIDTLAGDLDDLTFRDADGFTIGSVSGVDGMAATGTVALTAGAAVTQTEALTADELLLLGGVDFTLFNGGNDVNTIAADADDFAYADSDGFAIGSVNGTDGLTANALITLSAGGTVTQSEAITGTGLALLGGNDYTLTNVANDIDTLAGDLDDLTFRDADGFTIGSVTGTDGITSTGTVQLTAGAAVTQTEALTADELLLLGGVDFALFNGGNDVNTIAADADDFAYADSDGFTIGSINGTDGLTANALITLSAGGAVTQTEAITATDLLLLGGVDYTLTDAANDIDTLAADVDALSFTDSDTLTIGTVGGTAGLSATDNVTLTAGNNLIFNDDVTINAGSATTFDARADGNITVASNIALQSVGSAVDVILNADRNADNAGAIRLNDGSSIDSAGGDIVLGGGADPYSNAAVGTAGHGIVLDNAALDSGGGNIHITGDSDTAVDRDYGILIQDTSLLAGGGDITITGRNSGTGDFKIGTIFESATLTTNGSGRVTITGDASPNAANFNYGLYGFGTTITAADGGVDITGNGHGSGAANFGIYWFSSDLSASAAGDIRMSGVGGDNGAGTAIGIYSNDTTYQTFNGDIEFTGVGGASAGAANYGINLAAGSDIDATGAGSITLDGSGGGLAGGSQNDGMLIESTALTAADGDITLTGADGVSDNVNDSAAVHLDGATVRSTAGNIALNGTESSGDASTGIRLVNATTIGGAADPGDITFTADAMAINDTNDVIIHSAGNLYIGPESDAATIGLGDGAAGLLHLDAQEISALQDGFSSITIGRAGMSGAMHVTDLTLLDPATLRTTGALTLAGNFVGSDRVTLHTGAITQTAGGITVSALEVRSTGRVHLKLANDVDTIAIDADDHVVFHDVDGFAIGAVGSTSGMHIDGDLALFAGGNVTQTEAITANDLALRGAADFTLEHAGNDVRRLAADVTSLSFVDVDGLTVADVYGTTGITATGAAAIMTGSDLYIRSAITAGAVDLEFGGAGSSTLDLDAPVTGVVNITGGAGDDTVRIAVLAADLTIDGGGGSNTLHVDDAGETTGHSYTIVDGQVRRNSVLRTVDFTNIASLQITAGRGDDQVNSVFIPGVAQVLDGGPGTNRLDFDPQPAVLFSALSPLSVPGFGAVIHRNFTFTFIPLEFSSDTGGHFFITNRTGRNRLAQRSASGVRDSGTDAVHASLDADIFAARGLAELLAQREAPGRLLYRRARFDYRPGPARRAALVALSSHDVFATDEAKVDDATRMADVQEQPDTR